LHTVLTSLKRKDVVQPADLEETAGETGFPVGNIVKGIPVDRFEEPGRPTVEEPEMLSLGFAIGVGQGGATDFAKLGGELAGDGTFLKVKLDNRGWQEGDADGGCSLASKVIGGNCITPFVDLRLPWDWGTRGGGGS
jgi:hypothetical protein